MAAARLPASGGRGVKRIAILFLVALTAACANTAGDTPDPGQVSTTASAEASGTPSQAPAVAAPDGIEHIHNLALLEDGALLIGSHEGLWRQNRPGAELRRIGEPFDVMGFAVTDGGWLASGHPSSVSQGPPDLGLLRSTDEGDSWTTVALSGQVDFHRLVQSRRTILGANSGDGRLWRSSDAGGTWKTLGPAPFDIAIDPSDPRWVVGTTAEGVVISRDGGATWKPSGVTSRVALLSWDGADLFGVDPRGRVHRSADRGRTWEPVGDVQATPAALAATGGRVAVVAGERIWVSADQGRTFSPQVTGLPAPH